MRPTRYSMRRGMALILVLWLMTLLSAVALELALFSRLRLQATHNTGDGVRSLSLARGGIERAVAELKAAKDDPQGLEDLREDAERIYHNVELGEGSYTLLAEPTDSSGAELEYGISDEAAKVNLNTADAAMLSRVPGLNADLAADIILLRTENKAIHDVGDLLAIQRIDPSVLHGEDQNQNGLLDANEDDGDESWPEDNQDGTLDRGLAAYLTCDSAVRNAASDGTKRVNIAKATAQEIASGVEGISQQQAESIVEHRGKDSFESIADLLDVMLVEKKTEQKPEENNEGGQQGEQADATHTRQRRGRESGGGSGEREGTGGQTQGKGESQTTTTNKNAFDLEGFQAVADYVTVSEDEVLQSVINVNTASAEVLACLPGVDEALASAILDHRAGGKFESTAALLDVQGMSTEKFKAVCNLVTAKSDVFSVRSFGVLQRPGEPSAGTYCCVLAVIDRTEDKIRLGSWRELR